MRADETVMIDLLAAEMLGVFRSHRLDRRTDAPIDKLSIAAAYQVQDRVIAARVADGEQLAGYKVGCTSAAIRDQFGLRDPIRGCVLDPYVFPADAAIPIDMMVGAAIEPEFVLRIGGRVEGHDVDDHVLAAAIASIAPGIELHNYRFFHGDPSAQELIASNGIHAGLVIGTNAPAAVSAGDLELEGVGVFVNDRLVTSGIGAEIMGGPLVALRWLVGHLSDHGRALEPGQVVIPGSPVGLVRVSPGDVVDVRFTRLGSVRASFT